MLTNRSYFLVVYIHVGRIRIPAIISINMISMLVDGLMDIACFIRPFKLKVYSVLEIIESVMYTLQSCKINDLVEVKAKDGSDKVHIRIGLR